MSAARAAPGMLITRDSYAEIAERGKQEVSERLSFSLLQWHASSVPLAVDKPMHPVVSHPKEKKKKKEEKETRR